MREDEGITPQHVVGLVIHLLREIREQRIALDDVEFLSDNLLSQGYTKSEINAAFNWVFARLDGIEPADVLFRGDPASTSFRVLHPAERAILRPDAHGALIEMNILGMLSMEDMERIIERVMAFGGPLSADELLMLVHTYLFEEGSQTVSPGSYQFIQPSGTVH